MAQIANREKRDDAYIKALLLNSRITRLTSREGPGDDWDLQDTNSLLQDCRLVLDQLCTEGTADVDNVLFYLSGLSKCLKILYGGKIPKEDKYFIDRVKSRYGIARIKKGRPMDTISTEGTETRIIGKPLASKPATVPLKVLLKAFQEGYSWTIQEFDEAVESMKESYPTEVKGAIRMIFLAPYQRRFHYSQTTLDHGQDVDEATVKTSAQIEAVVWALFKGEITLGTLVVAPYADGLYSLVDGQQRLTSLLLFYLNKFPINFADPGKPPELKFFSQLQDVDKELFENYKFLVEIIQKDGVNRSVYGMDGDYANQLGVVDIDRACAGVYSEMNANASPLKDGELIVSHLYPYDIRPLASSWLDTYRKGERYENALILATMAALVIPYIQIVIPKEGIPLVVRKFVAKDPRAVELLKILEEIAPFLDKLCVDHKRSPTIVTLIATAFLSAVYNKKVTAKSLLYIASEDLLELSALRTRIRFEVDALPNGTAKTLYAYQNEDGEVVGRYPSFIATVEEIVKSFRKIS